MIWREKVLLEVIMNLEAIIWFRRPVLDMETETSRKWAWILVVDHDSLLPCALFWLPSKLSVAIPESPRCDCVQCLICNQWIKDCDILTCDSDTEAKKTAVIGGTHTHTHIHTQDENRNHTARQRLMFNFRYGKKYKYDVTGVWRKRPRRTRWWSIKPTLSGSKTEESLRTTLWHFLLFLS